MELSAGEQEALEDYRALCQWRDDLSDLEYAVYSRLPMRTRLAVLRHVLTGEEPDRVFGGWFVRERPQPAYEAALAIG